MTRATTIGVDLAKNVMQVHGVDAGGKVVVAQPLRRKQVLAFFAKQPSCLVGMEACGSAQHWARELTKLGHRVRLMPPKYVKAYVKRGKTDAGDAAAICEAVSRPSMTFVAVKSVEQQGLSMLHSVRQTLIGQRTQAINALRGHLSELGIVAAQGMLGLAELVAIVRDESDARLPATARAALLILSGRIAHASAEIAKLDAVLEAEHKTSATGKALDTIPSIGPVTASALRARVSDATQFKGGRHMAAWIGLVPEQDSSGGKVKQKGISKKGDRYLRQLLVNGAMAVIRQARRRPDKYPWVAGLLVRMPVKAVAIALANKTARIAWAIMVRGGRYQAGYRPARYQPAALAAPQ
jgi:transposase